MLSALMSDSIRTTAKALTVLLGSQLALGGSTVVSAEEALSIERRLGRTARYLSSDELGGRGIGTPGINQAADYIRREFGQLGLRTDLFDGGPYQRFQVTLDSELAEGAVATLIDSAGEQISLAVGESFQPLAIGGDGEFDLPLAFVGYGITAPEADYDDYAGIDATEKAVIILRHEPQQANPHSSFNGTEHSKHAPFRQKLKNAAEHGAAAVIFVTDQFEIDRR
ncbi:MAG: hypothetical protein AAGF31_00985, partial [Planctomycetota bacterium]